MRFSAVALLGLLACGGRAAPFLVADAGRGEYRVSETSPIYLTQPGGSNDLTVACDEAVDEVVTGGCEVGLYGQVVVSMAMPHGWMCAAVTTTDGVPLTAWVDCRAP